MDFYESSAGVALPKSSFERFSAFPPAWTKNGVGPLPVVPDSKAGLLNVRYKGKLLDCKSGV